MNAYPNGRARVTDESLQIHHKPCDVFEGSQRPCLCIGVPFKVKLCHR